MVIIDTRHTNNFNGRDWHGNGITADLVSDLVIDLVTYCGES